MERASAPRYDLFKLLITIALIVILLLMLLRGCATLSAVPEPTQTGGPVVTQTPLLSSTETEAIAASNTSAPPTHTSTGDIIASPASSPTPTAPAEPSPTPSNEDITATPTPAPIEASALDTATATPTGNQIASCNTSVPSRLSVGQSARVVQRLNTRSQPSITAPILRTNAINTEVEVFGGPICTPVGESAYLWWQIRLADGTEGWSAESPLNEALYLLEPSP
jgi:hypothetical protein